MPWQGYDRPIAPNLTKLAEQSLVYTNAYAVSSFTARSAGALLAGKLPSTLYRDAAFFATYSKANLFFPELLQQAGVHTMAIHAHGYFDETTPKNLRQGFEVWQVVPDLKWDAETDPNITGPKTTEMAIELLSKVDGKRPFFAWLHYMDPHDKYFVHDGVPRFGRGARGLYDSEVFFTDLQIQKLLDFCGKQSWWKDTILIVTSDHGEAFGEHDQYKHAFTLYQTLTHVPWMVTGPGIAPRRIDRNRSQLDLAPTIVELLGGKPSPGLAGKSLVAELRGAEPDDRDPILLELPADRYNPKTRALIQGKMKFIEEIGPKYSLFDLAKDPGETTNLAHVAAHKATFDELKKLLEDTWAKHPYVTPWGGRKLSDGTIANGSKGPEGWVDPDPPAPETSARR